MDVKRKQNAVVYCDDLKSDRSKPTREILAYSNRYRIVAIIDSVFSVNNSEETFNKNNHKVPIVKDFLSALEVANKKNIKLDCMVIGMYSHSLKFDNKINEVITQAIQNNLNIVSGLNDYLKDHRLFRELARIHDIQLVDFREAEKIVSRIGTTNEIDSIVLTVLGTDSEIGKRDMCRKIVDFLRFDGNSAEMIGTGLISVLQGVKYSIILDSLRHYSIPNKLHNKIYEAWINDKPNYIVVEGQSSLLDPLNPCGTEIIASAKPDVIILHHSLDRKNYINNKNRRIDSIHRHIKSIESISGKMVSAITIESTKINKQELEAIIKNLANDIDIPVYCNNNKGIEKLCKHVKLISGRVNSKKIKFNRRTIEFGT